MIHPIKPVLATAALLTLSACSATNVGESWQCPLAQAQGCSTVAEADPALPRETLEPEPVQGEALYRLRGTSAAGLPPQGDGSCGGDCEGGFDPLGWLAGLFVSIAADGDEPSSGAAVTGNARAENAAAADAPAAADATGAPSNQPFPVDSTIPAASTGAGAPGPLPAGTPVAGDAVAASATAPPPPASVAADAALREPEVIGRIWIAPFVDTDGHYREGAWVRTVLEPAGWRLR